MPVMTLAAPYEGWDDSHTHYYEYGSPFEDEVCYITEDKAYYYFQKDGGAVQKGWIKFNGAYYYGDPANGGKLALGWKKIGGYWYYFAKEYGTTDNGNFYYAGEMYGNGPDVVNGKW